MTQAYNLSQLANNLNSSGQLDATDGLVNAVPVANGGTGASSVSGAVANLSASIYPIGSVYINASVATNPATLLGFGTWVPFGSGRVLVGLDTSDTAFDTIGEIGGNKDAINVAHTHTATSTSTFTGSALPAHAHNFTQWSGPYTDTMALGGPGGGSVSGTTDSVSAGTPSGTVATTTTIASSGSSGTNANLQPYITVCMWLRTA